MLRNPVHRHDVRQVDFGRSGARQFYFRFFGGFFQSLQCHRVLAQVYAFFGFELIGQPIDNYVVEVITSEVGISVGRFYFEYAISQFKNRYIERTATEVEYGDFHIFICFVETVGQSCGSRFVDNTAHIQAGDFARFFGCLTLRVVEVSRYGNNGFVDLLSQIVFGRFFHFLKDHGRYFLRRIKTPVDVDTRHIVFAAYYFIRYTGDFVLDLIEVFTHETFDREDRTSRVGDSLTFGGVAHFTFATIYKCNNRRSRSTAFAVCYDNRIVAFHDGNTRVGCS